LSTLDISGSGSLSVRLVALPEGASLGGTGAGNSWALDLGEFSSSASSRNPNVATKRLRNSFVVSTQFGIEVRSTSVSAGAATLLALLQASQARYSVRIDGVLLGSASLPVAVHLRSGVTSRHLLEIEIPAGLAERDSRLTNVVQFSVVPE
jgi:hypothetical protein